MELGFGELIAASHLAYDLWKDYRARSTVNAQNFGKKLNAKNEENRISKEDFQNALLEIDPVYLKMILDKAAISDNDLVQEKYANLLSNSIAGKASQLDMFLTVLNQLSPKEVHLLNVYYESVGMDVPLSVQYASLKETLDNGYFRYKINYLTGFESNIKEDDLEAFSIYHERLVSLGIFVDHSKDENLRMAYFDKERMDIDESLYQFEELNNKYKHLTSETISIDNGLLVLSRLGGRLLTACK